MATNPRLSRAQRAAEAALGLPPVPVGSIMNFAGDCEDKSVLGSLARAGWLPCDGDLVQVNEYPELYEVIGISHGGEISEGTVVRFNLPEMNGRYARGVNGDAKDPSGKPIDPNVEDRQAAALNGNKKNQVGSYQPDATGSPRRPFQTESLGSHQHAVHHLTSSTHRAYSGTTYDSASHDSLGASTQAAGEHSHTLSSGGDAETRPVSLALYFIIKYV